MISTNDFRTGVTIELDGEVWQVVEFQHVKPGKGSAFVRTRLKNVKSGNVQDKTFRAGEKVQQATLERKEMQFLYSSGDNYEFMDNSTYEQMSISMAQLGKVVNYIKEGNVVSLLMYDGAIMGIEPPTFVELKVVETDPGFRGDTATGGNKPAKLETGALISVPLFVEIGDIIKIDTRTDTYLERV